jgi:peptidoglycan-associated lipoprotein
MKIFKLVICLSVSMLYFSFSSTAQIRSSTKEADKAFAEYKYFDAIELYKKAYSKEKNKAKKAEIMYNIGECYRLSLDPRIAESWYKKAFKVGYAEPEAVLNMANVLKVQGKYPEAIVEYTKYQSMNPSDPKGSEGIRSSEEAQKWMDEPSRFIVAPEVQLNSKQMEFAATYADKKGNIVYFVSTREGSTGKGIDGGIGENFSDIFESKRDKNGKWSTPVIVGGDINTPTNEGPLCIDGKGRTMFFTRCESPAKNKNQPCKIYVSTKKGNNWTDITLLELGPDTITVGHPSLSSDGNTLYFTATNMEGGKGGRDIWMASYDKKAKTWGNVTNVSSVNTEADDMYPFIHENGTLYFTSDGHPGMGGWDIFKATPGKNPGEFTNIENMKYPVNSPADDFAMVWEFGQERGFLSSNREGSLGSDDIFFFNIPPVIYVLQGTITDIKTRKPIANAKIKLVGSDGSSAEQVTDATGAYLFGDKGSNLERYIRNNTNYTLTVSANGYLNAVGKETTVGVPVSTTFIKDFALQPIEKEIAFPEVQYELAKFNLKPESKDSLDYLYQTLIDNPTLVIELSAHTDSRGSDQLNDPLSQKRAEACVEYLISKGIPADRMVPKGYGKRKLLISDAEIAKMKSVEEKEAGHQKNRRTVFSVLNDKYVPAGGLVETQNKSNSDDEEESDESEE